MADPVEWGRIALEHLLATRVPACLEHADALVLERIAHGAGQTNWCYCRGRLELDTVARRLSPGSDVRFYFDRRFERPAVDKVLDLARAIIADTGEVLVGVLTADGVQIEMNMVGGQDELLEVVNGLSVEAALFVGVFPGADNDGVSAVTTMIPDRDGIIRAHPH